MARRAGRLHGRRLQHQCVTWLVASGPSALELVVIDWLRRWLGYPGGSGGLFTSGGSAASLDAFVAAREAAGHPERATVYMSDQSHSAHVRAARIIGIRPEGIRMIAPDDRFRLDMQALGRAPRDDHDAGFNPIAVCANAGAASTGAIDPLGAISGLLRGGKGLAACGRRLRRFRGRDRGRKETSARDRARRFDRVGRAQVVLPDVRGGMSPDEGLAHARNAFRVGNDILQDTIWGRNHPNIADRGLQLSHSFRGIIRDWDTQNMCRTRRGRFRARRVADVSTLGCGISHAK